MAQRMSVPFLGRIPLDPALGQASELGCSAFGEADEAQSIQQSPQVPSAAPPNGSVQAWKSSPTLSSLRRIIDKLVLAAEGLQEGDAADLANEPASGNSGGLQLNGVPGYGNAQGHQDAQKGSSVPNQVVLSNGDIPLDPALHYRIHLGM